MSTGRHAGTWGWSVDLGIFVDFIGYFYLYEWSTKHGYEYDRTPTVVTAQISFDLYYKNFQVSFELYPSSPLGESLESYNDYGRVNLIYYVP